MKFKKCLLATLSIIFLGVASGVALTWKFAQTDDFNACVSKHASRWGAKCTQCSGYSPNSYTVVVKNTCADKLDIKLAVQESTKKWRCFTHTAVAQNDTVIGYACNGTGKYLKWARKAGDNSTIFPTDDEINKQYFK